MDQMMEERVMLERVVATARESDPMVTIGRETGMSRCVLSASSCAVTGDPRVSEARSAWWVRRV